MKLIKRHKYLFGLLAILSFGMLLGPIFAFVGDANAAYGTARFTGNVVGFYLLIGGPIKIFQMINRKKRGN